MRKSEREKFWSLLLGHPAYLLTTKKQVAKKRKALERQGKVLVKV